MNQNLVPINAAKPPARVAQRVQSGVATTHNFADNVMDSFPRISIRGKRFYLRYSALPNGEIGIGGFDTTMLNLAAGPQPVGPFLDIVLVNASDMLAKSYYVNTYQSSAAENGDQPDCWSLDSVRPDPSIPMETRVRLGTGPNGVCLDCPKNAFGSASGGRPGKACQDSRRVVVTTQQDLNTPQPTLLMLRVPQQSLKNMKAYVEHLAKYGYEPGACITRLSFDPEVAEYPKLLFTFAGPLNDPEFDAICDMIEPGGKNVDRVQAMLKRPDFDTARSNAQPTQAQATPVTTAPPVQQQQPTYVPPVHPQQQAVGGFGSLVQGAQQQAQPEPIRTAPQPVTPGSQAESWDDLGDGNEINPTTGEIRAKAHAGPTLEMDPDVIPTSTGGFYHRGLKRMVDSPYRGAKPIVATPQQAEAPAQPQQTGAASPATAAPPKRTRKAKGAETPPAQEATPAAPAEAQKGNGGDAPVDGPKPIVVPASPKLEALLGGLTPPKGQ